MARRTTTGRVVQGGVIAEAARRAGQVARSPEVQRRAKEMAPAAGRLVEAVRREWRR